MAARERIDVLEEEQSRLMKELGRVESELAKLMSGAAGKAPAVRKKVREQKLPPGSRAP